MPKTERGAFFVPEEQLVEMVERMKNGDEQAEEDMQKMFKGYLSRYFYTKARSCHIDKLVSNTFYQVNKSIHKLEEPAAFVSWIKTIAHREVYHFYREIQQELEQKEKEKKRKES